jgi:hypothetical protein
MPARFADGDPLGQEVLQDSLHLADGELGWNEFVDDGWMRFFQVVQQHLDILPA